MTQRNIILLAKQGNPKAIEAILNHYLQPMSITVKAARKDSCLHVLLKAQKPLKSEKSVKFIYKIITKIQPSNISKISIEGRRTGEDISDWHKEIELNKLTISEKMVASNQDNHQKNRIAAGSSNVAILTAANSFGQTLEALIKGEYKNQELAIRDIAFVTGLSREQILAIVKGSAAVPDIATIRRIARIFQRLEDDKKEHENFIQLGIDAWKEFAGEVDHTLQPKQAIPQQKSYLGILTQNYESVAEASEVKWKTVEVKVVSPKATPNPEESSCRNTELNEPIVTLPMTQHHQDPENTFVEGATLVAGGTAAGAGVAATVGGMGLVGGFGGVAIGAAPVVAAGAVVGSAAYGAKKAIEEGDATALGAVAGGAAVGAGVSAVVGGMGLAVGGTAVAIGMAPVAAAGAVLGLALYGLNKLFGDDSDE